MSIGFATVKTTQQINDFLFSAEKFISTVVWWDVRDAYSGENRNCVIEALSKEIFSNLAML